VSDIADIKWTCVARNLNGVRTFEGRTLAALTLPQKKDPDVGAALFELCALYTKLFIDCIADLFGSVFCENAGIALSGCLTRRGAESGLEKVGSMVLWYRLCCDHGGKG
jgi:hypothetical protein